MSYSNFKSFGIPHRSIFLTCFFLITGSLSSRCVICYTRGGTTHCATFQGRCEDYPEAAQHPDFIGCVDIQEMSGPPQFGIILHTYACGPNTWNVRLIEGGLIELEILGGEKYPLFDPDEVEDYRIIDVNSICEIGEIVFITEAFCDPETIWN